MAGDWLSSFGEGFPFIVGTTRLIFLFAFSWRFGSICYRKVEGMIYRLQVAWIQPSCKREGEEVSDKSLIPLLYSTLTSPTVPLLQTMHFLYLLHRYDLYCAILCHCSSTTANHSQIGASRSSLILCDCFTCFRKLLFLHFKYTMQVRGGPLKITIIMKPQTHSHII